MEIINIIITGTDGSLVSKFIKSAAGVAPITFQKKFSADFPYQELELGRVNIDEGRYLYLVGTPLDDDYKVIWRRSAKELAGMVIIVSPNNPKKDIDKAKTLIDKLAALNLPYLVVFTSADKVQDEKKLRRKLNLAAETPHANVDLSSEVESRQAILSLLVSVQDIKSRLKSA